MDKLRKFLKAAAAFLVELAVIVMKFKTWKPGEDLDAPSPAGLPGEVVREAEKAVSSASSDVDAAKGRAEGRTEEASASRADTKEMVRELEKELETLKAEVKKSSDRVEAATARKTRKPSGSLEDRLKALGFVTGEVGEE